MTNTKHLFAKFLRNDILVEQGRLLYSLLYAFLSAGYRVSLFDNLPPENLGRCGKLVLSMKDVILTRSIPNNPTECIYLYDKEDRSLGKLHWDRRIEIKSDLFSSYCFKTPIIMPYVMHPRQTGPDLAQRLERCRNIDKRFKIFFSGDTKNYDRNRIQYPGPKIPRLEVINTLLERLGDNIILVKDTAMLEELHGSAHTDKCVIVDTNNIWVEEREWLSSLAKADFFLSPPGIAMPMCHNIIEAMAVGAIPITNYPEWLQPNLVHMENCIVFEDKNDLIDKINSALEMKAEQIAAMRKNVIKYYELYLKPSAIVKTIESRHENKTIVLLYTENNVRKNWSKLNKHSILMRSGSATSEMGLVKCLLQKLLP